ncbi:Serine-threonine/tyrosine-protein kinase, catalytic domain [Dillenia turbinata]|uniref:Serine-threonine/tyrosine-protein kinase, catalytic domain n=1 Tax=Dillenia turbinata TaxID=194707 RepID=A0AAN8VBL9_9MAGN
MISLWRYDRFNLLRIGLLVLVLLFQRNFIFSLSLNDEGWALMKFRERAVRDPFGDLSNWNSNGEGKYEDDALHGSKVYRRLQQQFPASHSPTKDETESKLTPSPAPSPPSSSSSFAPSPNAPSMSPSGSPFLSSSFPPTSPSPESPVSSPSALFSPTPSPLPAVPPNEASSPPASPPNVAAEPSPSHNASALSPALVPNNVSKTASHTVIIWCSVAGGSLFVIITAIGIILYRGNKVVTVRPWATGLSGQLQKAFVTGVPSLKRSELEVACEDFSNVIGTLGDVNVYKGTLSSGVEIAVTSTGMTSRDEWSTNLETQFRNKIESLSKVNHKNFVNLIGFCEEGEPFTRMMVFEYAPNGTLFEHLHIQEAEHLDWGMRVRIAMGMAYCLEYMHQMTPPTAHKNLQSSSVYLTEDYAAKISDFSFWTQLNAANIGLAKKELLAYQSADPESNVHSFGAILLEMITGRLPYSVDNGSLTDWASNLLSTDKPLSEIVDPTLESFSEEELKQLLEVVKECISPDPGQRPTMRDVTAKLKEITAMGPDGATPKSSPLWWAELEIMSSETS